MVAPSRPGHYLPAPNVAHFLPIENAPALHRPAASIRRPGETRALLLAPAQDALVSARADAAGIVLDHVRTFPAAAERLRHQAHAGLLCAASFGASPLAAFVRRVRASDPRIVILLFGGTGDLPAAVEGMKAGADDFLRRTEDLPDLAARFAAATARRAEKEERRERLRSLERAVVEHRSEIARRRLEAEVLFLKSVRSLALSIEAKDRYTKAHSEKVAAVADRIAARLGLGSGARRPIRVAALLHDVGKIGVDEAILRKKGPLTSAEFGEIRKHPLIGARILSPLAKRYPEIVRCVRHEHERFDGRGYPDGLRAYEIPLGARVIAVADCYDAIISDRPYRVSQGKAEAEAVVRANSGTQFDPEVVEAFLAILPDLPGPEEPRHRGEKGSGPREESRG